MLTQSGPKPTSTAQAEFAVAVPESRRSYEAQHCGAQRCRDADGAAIGQMAAFNAENSWSLAI